VPLSDSKQKALSSENQTKDLENSAETIYKFRKSNKRFRKLC
jgi:hypothetical protein